MANFVFRLQTLLRIRENEREARQRALAEALEAESILRQRVDAVAQEIHAAQQEAGAAAAPGPIHVDRLRDHRRYELVLRSQVQMLEQQVRSLLEEVERRRQALVEADRQVRLLEKLRERRQAEFEQAEQAREQKRLDEIGQVRKRDAK